MEKDIRISLLFDFYGPVLSDKIRKAVDLYHNDDLSLSEISLEMGITRQGVRDLVKRGEQRLLEYESRLKLFERFNNVKSGIEEIKTISERIITESSQSPQEDAKRIEEIAEKIVEEF